MNRYRLQSIAKNNGTFQSQAKFISYGSLIVLLFASVILPVLVSVFYLDIYVARYFIASTPILVLFITASLYMMRKSVAIHVICLIMLAISAPNILKAYRVLSKNPWQDLAGLLLKEFGKKDIILLEARYPGYLEYILKHYLTYGQPKNEGTGENLYSIITVREIGPEEDLKKINRYIDSKNPKLLWIVSSLSLGHSSRLEKLFARPYDFKKRSGIRKLSVWRGMRK